MSRQETLLYPLAARASIIDLATRQRKKRESQPPLPDNLASRKEIFSWFKKTEAIRQIYTQALRYSVVPRTEREIEVCRAEIAGEVFQQIAFAYLSQRLAADQILLSPERTFDLYHKNLFPGKKVVRHPIGTPSLLGISVPDGLLVENEPFGLRIAAAVEYTLDGRWVYFQNKIVHFKGDQEKFPSLFQNSQLLFVTPTFKANQPAIPQGEAELRRLPFSHRQFRHFSNWFYGDYRPYQDVLIPDSASATLKEIQERAREKAATQALTDHYSSSKNLRKQVSSLP